MPADSIAASNRATTALERRLIRQIAQQGPVTVAAFMSQALTDPEHGYYMTADRFGRDGDFTTAPEISQMFGELLGLWAIDSWQKLDAPQRVILAELGPGRGTLMADALRAARMVPDFLAAAEIHLVEISPILRDSQRARLSGHNVVWHDDVGSLPEGPMILIANEVFDALPVRQFERQSEGWSERMVVLDDQECLAFGLTHPDPAIDLLIPSELRDAATGALYEVSPAAEGLVAAIADRLLRGGGAALILDYGRADSGPGFSLQALRGHARADPLARPGEVDLSTHVDFQALAQAARRSAQDQEPITVLGPIDQSRFLTALGIEARAETLIARASPAQAEDIRAALKRLTAPDQMGALFKVLGLCHKTAGPVAGFP